jgi:hypothetical protein
MAGVGLVRDRPHQVAGPDGKVQVDLDPRPSAAVVPVGAGPWPVADHRDPAALALGQPEQHRRAGAEDLGQVVHGRGNPLRVDRQRGVPGFEPFDERTVAGDERVEVSGRGPEDGVVRAGHPAVKAACQEILVPDRLTGDVAGLGLEGDQLGAEPFAPLGVGDLAGQAFVKLDGVLGEPRRRPQRLHVRGRLQVRRAEVGVHEPRPVLVQPQRQEKVVASDRIRGGDGPHPADGRDALDHRARVPSVSATK